MGVPSGIVLLSFSAAVWLGASAAHAQCFPACGAQSLACVQAARATKQACREQCRAQASVAEKIRCLRDCRTQYRDARAACRNDGDACIALCLPTNPVRPGQCVRDCAAGLHTCARTVNETLRPCIAQCDAAADRPACLRSCSQTAASDARSCAQGFLACLEQCRPSGPPESDCACGSACTTPAGGAGMCLPRWLDTAGFSCTCVALPCNRGQCVDVAGATCTGTPCSLSEPCPEGQLCDLVGAKCPCSEAQPCATDADCKDPYPCTTDRCTPTGCVHECLCMGLGGCGPGWIH